MSIDFADVSCDRPYVFAPPEPSEAAEKSSEVRSVLGIAELLLKDVNRLDRLARDESQQTWLIPSFLAIGLASFSLFALVLVVTLDAAPAAALPEPLVALRANHRTASAIALWLAYTLGFTLATGVCLPSFYFYGLLAGIRATWLQVTTQIMKGSASTAMMLLGVLPIYFALALGAVVFRMPPADLRIVLWAGLGLPFVAGLWGVRAIYRGFVGLSETMPAERRCARECWLRRLTLACTACYSAVCPVMIYTLWTHFAAELAKLGL